MKKLLFLLLLVPTLAFAQIQPGEPYYVESVNNKNVRSMAEIIDRFIWEIYNSQSSQSSAMRQADRTRIDEFIISLKAYRDQTIAQPEVDAAHSHPRGYAISYVTDTLENEMVNLGLRDLADSLIVMSIELTASASARDSSGLQAADLDRLNQSFAEIEHLLTTFIDPSTPFDSPENVVRQNREARGE